MSCRRRRRQSWLRSCQCPPSSRSSRRSAVASDLFDIWRQWPPPPPPQPREFSKSISRRQRIINRTNEDREWKIVNCWSRDFYFLKKRTTLTYRRQTGNSFIKETNQIHLKRKSFVGDRPVQLFQLIRGAKPPLCCSRKFFIFLYFICCVSRLRNRYV